MAFERYAWPRLEQLREHLGVPVGLGGLEDRALVPVEIQPPERIEDLFDVLRGRSLAVGIFDPQHERASLAAREQPVVESGPRPADVEGACW